MGSKIHDFLFPSKGKNDVDETRVIIKNESDKMNNVERNVNNSTPNIVKPQIFSQVEGIANKLLDGSSMIVDLTSTDIGEAKRICDFLNGVTYALHGKVEKIARLVYLFDPKND